jgi:hypothetical protein
MNTKKMYHVASGPFCFLWVLSPPLTCSIQSEWPYSHVVCLQVVGTVIVLSWAMNPSSGPLDMDLK